MQCSLAYLEAQLEPDGVVGEQEHVKEMLLHTNVSMRAAVRTECKTLALHLNLYMSITRESIVCTT